jgi:hypothetical protein
MTRFETFIPSKRLSGKPLLELRPQVRRARIAIIPCFEIALSRDIQGVGMWEDGENVVHGNSEDGWVVCI